jgi:antibiotic biosynthesis monooxygenase (ABM) superfamily enzyme
MTNNATGSATMVFSRKLGPGQHEKYEDWLGQVMAATSGFAGYGGTTLLRPAAPNEEYTAIVHFDTTERLERWLTSAERTECLRALEDIAVESEEISSLAGLDHWVSLKGGIKPPPDWKMAVLILVGLYPIVILDALYLSPLLAFLPWPVGILVSLMVSVPIMVWIVLPLLSKLLGRWLCAQTTGVY